MLFLTLFGNCCVIYGYTVVPDKRIWILEVVVVRRYSPGYWEFGVGREGEGLRKGRSVYE